MVGMTPRLGRLRPPRHRPLRSWLALRELVLRGLVLRGLVLLAACLALTGCRPVDLPSSTTASIRVGGVTRTYRLFVPTGLTGPAPLVVVLHGGYGSGAQAETAYHWDDRATAGGFVVAFPDGLHRSWNAGGGCCGQAGRDGVDDVAFLTALVAEVGRRVPVDPRRVYATGMSNGGIMTYRLACETDLFAAVAPVAATRLVGCPAPARMSVLAVHGIADPIVPYQGGPGGSYGPAGAHVDGPPVPDVVAEWRTVDGCAEPSVANTGAVTTSTAPCPDGRSVTLVTVAGLGHEWPGSAGPGDGGATGSGGASAAVDATAVIWDFFAAHPGTR